MDAEIAGRATLTIVASNNTRKNPRQTPSSAHPPLSRRVGELVEYDKARVTVRALPRPVRGTMRNAVC
ncbi:hypothetical protein Raf01_94730 [Rugosimonospora africana]|uniref:Uncharacterized protein n=1 Tax=Rugosimonospora africana TaxID=556532 RepID=A0A8J3R2Y4_9ACTN|nr:hypothetical protein Raf01_94730 [Rugosimonospora africana]